MIQDTIVFYHRSIIIGVQSNVLSRLGLFGTLYLPVLSAQLITAPTGRPSEMRNFAPAEPPRPKREIQKLIHRSPQNTGCMKRES